MLEASVYKERLDRLHGHLATSDTQLAILTPSPGFQYLTGIDYVMRERLVALLIQPEAEPKLVVPAFEESDHAAHTWIENLESWAEDVNPYKMVADLAGTEKASTTVMLNNDMPIGVYWSLEQAFGGFKSAESLTPFISSMRLKKTDFEVDLIKKAGRIIDKAVMKAFWEARIGMSESQVKQIVENEVVRLGAKPTFAAVQFGENSALPHHESGARELAKGDLVLMDCGCSLEGYNTDQTRVGVVGEPTEEMERVYSIVLKAEETAIEQLKAGLTCGSADGIARRIIDEAGYGERFTHRLGHGIGLEVHEPPYLVRGNSQELQPGMCHSVEPGVYLEGNFGIRMEDLVCVGESGVEALTYSPKDLHRIEV
jgi:Xaa-Pro aminopeptidase